MTTKQLGHLNALVTFAAENVPGGLSKDERQVAKVVGEATLLGDPRMLNTIYRWRYKFKRELRRKFYF